MEPPHTAEDAYRARAGESWGYSGLLIRSAPPPSLAYKQLPALRPLRFSPFDVAALRAGVFEEPRPWPVIISLFAVLRPTASERHGLRGRLSGPKANCRQRTTPGC